MLKKISIGSLRPGMILGEDILNNDALVLISRGKVLDEKLIEMLIKRYGSEKYIVIYIPQDGALKYSDTEKYPEAEKAPASMISPPVYHEADLNLNDVQTIIQNVFPYKKDYQATKKILETIQNEVAETFEFLLTNNEIQDKKFLNIAHLVINNIQHQGDMINSGYLYLLELEKWHPDTLNHSIDVAFFTLFIASQSSSDIGELSSLFLGGLLHDIGKYVHYREGETRFYDIITKVGPLTDEEFQILKKHVDIDYFFNNKFTFLPPKERDNIVFGAIDHHEKLDGKGYLKGKRGMQISLAGRIIAVADIYDAMVRKREYKSMVKPNIAMRHVISLGEAGKLDKKFVIIFRNLLGLYPIGTVISTNQGFAIVTGQSKDPNRPIVILTEHHELRELNLTEHPEIEIYEKID